MAQFQRSNTLDHQDVSDSSDAVNDYYDSDNPQVGMIAKDEIAAQLRELTKRPLTRLDRILLKGFYTNDRIELENPSLLPAKNQGRRTPIDGNKVSPSDGTDVELVRDVNSSV